MSDKKGKPTIFQKIMEAGQIGIDSYISKAKADIHARNEEEFYRKSVYSDYTLTTGSKGYHDKAYRLSFQLQKEMSRRDTIISSIIATYQNKAAKFARVAENNYMEGFQVKLKDEETALKEIMDELRQKTDIEEDVLKSEDIDQKSREQDTIINQKDTSEDQADLEKPQEGMSKEQKEVDTDMDGEVEEKELERKARKILAERTAEKRKAIQDFVLHCGRREDRPFESKKWNFEAYVRTQVRDTCTYDWIATERVPDNKGDLHHFVPVDSATIRFSSPQLAKQKGANEVGNAYDILYPEKELEALDRRDALKLDEEKLEENEYKYVQVIKGRIERAFTEEELFVGMRNPVTDIYSNGYSLSEMELLIPLVSSHIFTENHYRSFYTNGFSTKGILHIKANLNRRKLETVRLQWKHMVSGPKNQFQTPIMAGMDDVKWIPLNNGNDGDKESWWMNYLIKGICGIFQIDPKEIGFGMKDSGGAGMSGDDTKEKLDHSASKGFVPMMRFLENEINENIIDFLDPDYKIEFIGLTDESQEAALARQEKEVKFKKSVNEVRQEDGLDPIPGADDLILDPTYMQWFSQFHPDGKKMREEMQANDMQQQGISAINDIQDQYNNEAYADEPDPEGPFGEAAQEEETTEKSLKKSLVQIEYYGVKDEDKDRS